MSAVGKEPVNRLSHVESVKLDSNFLRGTIVESLHDPVTGAVAEDDQVLLKFHGTYQQDDRDIRNQRQRQKLEPDYGFMIRARIPSGKVSAQQWLALDEIATRYAKHSIRLTTRQTVQYHRVEKQDLKTAIKAINDTRLTTIAACGDVNRNVLSTSNPALSPVHARTFELARAISDHLCPATRAYSEIWLDGKALEKNDEEPVYGRTYLPRKFKIALAVPPDNDVDVYTNDLGYVAIVEDGHLLGYNVLVGGGMGMTHGDKNTYPCVGRVIGMCAPDQVVAVAEQVVTIQRDFGDRTERKHARFKYTIDDRGVAWFRQELEQRLGFQLSEAHPFHFATNADRPGWRQDSVGHWHLCLQIMSGRISDYGAARYLSGLRAIAQTVPCNFIMTANQNLIISDLNSAGKARIEVMMTEYGMAVDAGWKPLRQQAMACVGLPTCGLAMAESERALPAFVERLEAVMASLGLADAPITLRITGCPNGCARPYVAEIGLVGKGPGRYNLYLGAAADGSRLNRLYRENIGEDSIISELTPLLTRYAEQRHDGEAFGDFLIRAGEIRAVTEGKAFHD